MASRRTSTLHESPNVAVYEQYRSRGRVGGPMGRLSWLALPGQLLISGVGWINRPCFLAFLRLAWCLFPNLIRLKFFRQTGMSTGDIPVEGSGSGTQNVAGVTLGRSFYYLGMYYGIRISSWRCRYNNDMYRLMPSTSTLGVSAMAVNTPGGHTGRSLFSGSYYCKSQTLELLPHSVFAAKAMQPKPRACWFASLLSAKRAEATAKINLTSNRKSKKKGNVSPTREHLLRTYAPHPHFKVAAARARPVGNMGRGPSTHGEQKLARKIP